MEVSSGLLLAYTIGAVVGPTTAAWLMGWIGPQALFIHNTAIHIVFVIFIALTVLALRRNRRPAILPARL